MSAHLAVQLVEALCPLLIAITAWIKADVAQMKLREHEEQHQDQAQGDTPCTDAKSGPPPTV